MAIFIILLIFIIVVVYSSRKTERMLSRSGPACLEPEYVVIDSGVAGPTIGMVGSVHGNEPAGAYTLSRMVAHGEFKPIRGKLIIITKANPCGLLENMRQNPHSLLDINRQFDENGGNDFTSQKIIEILKSCDLILDFHEGWGWHLETKSSWNPVQQISVGSTITPGEHAFWKELAPRIVDRINVGITDPMKKFSVIWGASCKIPSSLNCYASQNARPYLLIETSGQNDIQPIEVREAQNRIVIQTVMEYFKIV
jgi:hypothetical protein